MEYKSKEREPEVETEAQSIAVESISVAYIDLSCLRLKHKAVCLYIHRYNALLMGALTLSFFFVPFNVQKR